MSDSPHILESGYLKVSELHSIYFERCGTPGINPILFIHGGPGAGFTKYDKRFFDFSQQEVIFFDQRGAAKSRPFGEIKENTIQDLASDITRLLDSLKIESVHLFGGSWGTTLALFFAINNPSRVKSILLRAVFLGNKDDIKHFTGGGTQEKCPKEWNRFIQQVPEESRHVAAKYYLSKITEGTKDERDKYCYEWAYNEISIFDSKLNNEEINKIINSYSFKSLALIESYYLSNNCFLSDDYILNHLDAIKDIPCTIIHGQNDNICPVSQAVLLDSKLNNSTLYLEDAGHSDRVKSIESRIISVLDNIKG